eukprot:230029-Amphidinium_carterae.1
MADSGIPAPSLPLSFPQKSKNGVEVVEVMPRANLRKNVQMLDPCHGQFHIVRVQMFKSVACKFTHGDETTS